MSIKPIDMQVMIPKMPEVSKRAEKHGAAAAKGGGDAAEGR